MRKQAFFPAGQKDRVELEPLGRMEGHQCHPLAIVGLIDIHHQARHARGSRLGSRTRPWNGSVPSGSPAASGPAGSCRTATSGCSRSRPESFQPDRYGASISIWPRQRSNCTSRFASERRALPADLLGLDDLTCRLVERNAARPGQFANLAQ